MLTIARKTRAWLAAPMSLHQYLTRLILLCVLPLLLLAAFLAVESVRKTRAETDIEAANLAKNFATAIDQNLAARIGALNILANSPFADSPAQWEKLYQEAQGFRESFGSHVILADVDMRILFNTRVPFGDSSQVLPRSKGRAAAPIAIETGKPAVGDTYLGPVTRETMVAIVVPGMRDGKAAFLVLSAVEIRQFQRRIDQLALPEGWSLALLDGDGQAIARRTAPGLNAATDVDPAGRFIVRSQVAAWSVVLEIPRAVYREPLLAAGASLAIALLSATLAGTLGGVLAGRRLGKSVASLTQVPGHAALAPNINEIAAARRLLDESATRRESAEASLRESERRFRATFEQAAVGIALVSPGGRWLRTNQKLCGIVGYSHDELLALSFQDITHPDDLDADLAMVKKMLAAEIVTYSMEKRYIRKDRAIVWINLSVSLVRHSDGTPDSFIAVIEDIQRRKEAESALLAREGMLREAQRLAGIGNWTWDLRTDRHVWSEEIYRIYERDPALPPAVYPEVQSYFTPESWARLAAAVEAGRALGTAYECDAEVVRPDGTHCWITVRGEPVRDAAGEVVEMHGTVQDITERRHAAEALRELNASLEKRVESRTAELVAANRELESFAYAVSHDLRAPLRSVDGFARALEEDYAPLIGEEGRDALRRVRAAAQKMGNLIDDLLTLSRLTVSEMNLETIDLGALARSIIDELRRAEPGRKVSFTCEPGLDVHGDKRLVAVLLQNLLGNAWKYTGKRQGANIHFGATRIAGKKAFLVRDDGAGFDMARAANLFTPFQRLHSDREFPGTGIGLATARRIVRRHGGRIWAEGTVDKGATIHFTIPS